MDALHVTTNMFLLPDKCCCTSLSRYKTVETGTLSTAIRTLKISPSTWYYTVIVVPPDGQLIATCHAIDENNGRNNPHCVCYGADDHTDTSPRPRSLKLDSPTLEHRRRTYAVLKFRLFSTWLSRTKYAR